MSFLWSFLGAISAGALLLMGGLLLMTPVMQAFGRRFVNILIRDAYTGNIFSVVNTLRRVTPLEDGRFELVTVGAQRFRLLALDQSQPYLRGEIDLLAEETGDEAAAALAVGAVRRAFGEYLAALATQRAARITLPELPDEPVPLSYVVAATIIVDLADRQLLLAEPDAVARLTAERAMLARETAMLRTLPSTPATDLRNTPYHPN